MRPGTCKHYNGSFHNKTCDAGICYRDVTPEPDRIDGSALRLPCRAISAFGLSPSQMEEFNKRGKCNKYEEPTQDELDERDTIMEGHMKRMMLTLPLIAKIKGKYDGNDWCGIETCPACGGSLHMSHSSYNGHVHGKCEIEGCLSWME